MKVTTVVVSGTEKTPSRIKTNATTCGAYRIAWFPYERYYYSDARARVEQTSTVSGTRRVFLARGGRLPDPFVPWSPGRSADRRKICYARFATVTRARIRRRGHVLCTIRNTNWAYVLFFLFSGFRDLPIRFTRARSLETSDTVIRILNALRDWRRDIATSKS